MKRKHIEWICKILYVLFANSIMFVLCALPWYGVIAVSSWYAILAIPGTVAGVFFSHALFEDIDEVLNGNWME